MEKLIKEKVLYILNEVNRNGLKWKLGKDVSHLKTRKKYGHIPQEFTMREYECVIISLMNGDNNDVFIFFRKGFEQDYFVFGDGSWIVIIGENCIMETSFKIDKDYNEFLSEAKGYKYIGKVKEVFE